VLRGIPEDVRSEIWSLLVCSVPLDLTEVPTFVHCISCEQRLVSSSQGPLDLASFSQGLRHTYSVKIYLSLMADRRLGGPFMVFEPHLAYRNFRTRLTARSGSTPLGLKLLEDLLHTPWSTAGKRWLEIRARTGSVRVGEVLFPCK
jgi:hypothetical protein